MGQNDQAGLLASQEDRQVRFDVKVSWYEAAGRYTFTGQNMMNID
jgi:hypothetical protein